MLAPGVNADMSAVDNAVPSNTVFGTIVKTLQRQTDDLPPFLETRATMALARAAPSEADAVVYWSGGPKTIEPVRWLVVLA